VDADQVVTGIDPPRGWAGILADYAEAITE
jgi:hypothetical protein